MDKNSRMKSKLRFLRLLFLFQFSFCNLRLLLSKLGLLSREWACFSSEFSRLSS